MQRLPFGQLLSGGDGHDRFLLSAPPVGIGDIGSVSVIVGPSWPGRSGWSRSTERQA
jgi:hypothetical protein